MTEPLRKLQTPDGKFISFQNTVIDLGMIEHLGLSLRLRGASDADTQALAQALREAQADGASGFSDTGYHHHIDTVAIMLARNWVAELSPPLDYDALGSTFQNMAQTRFGRHFWGIEENAIRNAAPLPDFDAPRAAIAKSAMCLRVDLPRALTDSAQRAGLHTEESVASVLATQAWVERLCPLYDAAIAEWSKAKLARPRSNPLAKAVAFYQSAQWIVHEDESALRSGSFWMPASDTAEGLMFLSPNGSQMREISRGKPFASSQEALEWGRRHGATAAVELNWSLGSFVPMNKAANPTLDKVFAIKESRELGEAIDAPSSASQTPAQAPAPKARRPKGAL